MAYGDRIGLDQGQPPYFHCHGDTIRDPNFPVLGYGQSRQIGTIRCVSTTSGMTCTDTSSGHGFTLSRDSYNLT
jgi:hypothetical protein